MLHSLTTFYNCQYGGPSIALHWKSNIASQSSWPWNCYLHWSQFQIHITSYTLCFFPTWGTFKPTTNNRAIDSSTQYSIYNRSRPSLKILNWWGLRRVEISNSMMERIFLWREAISKNRGNSGLSLKHLIVERRARSRVLLLLEVTCGEDTPPQAKG